MSWREARRRQIGRKYVWRHLLPMFCDAVVKNQNAGMYVCNGFLIQARNIALQASRDVSFAW